MFMSTVEYMENDAWVRGNTRFFPCVEFEHEISCLTREINLVFPSNDASIVLLIISNHSNTRKNDLFYVCCL